MIDAQQIDFLTGGLALFAAIFWGAAAFVRFPHIRTLEDAKRDGGTVSMSGMNKEQATTVAALRRQGKMSAIGAGFACLAAIAQALAPILGTHP